MAAHLVLSELLARVRIPRHRTWPVVGRACRSTKDCQRKCQSEPCRSHMLNAVLFEGARTVRKLQLLALARGPLAVVPLGQVRWWRRQLRPRRRRRAHCEQPTPLRGLRSSTAGLAATPPEPGTCARLSMMAITSGLFASVSIWLPRRASADAAPMSRLRRARGAGTARAAERLRHLLQLGGEVVGDVGRALEQVDATLAERHQHPRPFAVDVAQRDELSSSTRRVQKSAGAAPRGRGARRAARTREVLEHHAADAASCSFPVARYSSRRTQGRGGCPVEAVHRGTTMPKTQWRPLRSTSVRVRARRAALEVLLMPGFLNMAEGSVSYPEAVSMSP